MSDPAARSQTRRIIVIGGGISGLAAAEHLTRQSAVAVEVLLLEASPRLGGIIKSEQQDGFVMEHGPDVALATKPAAVALATRLGLANRIVRSNPLGALVGTPRGLRRLPQTTWGVLPASLRAVRSTGILSARGLLRIAAEPLIPPRRDNDDESIESFVVRRIGREAYERITQPLLTGIYAGDGNRLSVVSTFPHLRAAEREHGSVTRARSRHTPAKPEGGSPFVSFDAGMGTLIDALAKHLESTGHVELRCNAPVREVRLVQARGTSRPVVCLANGELLDCDGVVIATPAGATASLLASAHNDISRELDAIEHQSTAIVTLGFRGDDVRHPLDGTGYVQPRYLDREVMACTWSSSKFSGRAPAHMRLLRVFIGGAQRPRHPELDDDSLRAMARAELRAELGIEAAPVITRVTRWMRSMPQYTIGHAQQTARIERAMAAHPAVVLAGNMLHGVGIPDRIAHAGRAADQLLGALAGPPGSTPVESSVLTRM